MRRKTLLLLVCLTAHLNLSAQEERVLYSDPGGFYEESFPLSLHCFYANHHIHYTTNGATPTAASPRYDHPLPLDESLYSTSDIYTIQNCPSFLFHVPDSVRHAIVIRAAVFDDYGQRLSEVATNTYLISTLGFETHGLPVLSISADSLALFDYYTGIMVPGVNFNPSDSLWTGNYYQSGEDWERCVHVEFIETNGVQTISQDAGLRTHGGTGRRGHQKGLKIYAREEYGKKRFKHKFFDELPNDSFKHLVLRPFTCQWFTQGIQDDICNRMAGEINVEHLASRPVSLFLNGEYWGIYYIKEKPDANYLEDHFGNGDDEYNVIESWYGNVTDGENVHFMEMMNWLKNCDLTEVSDYQRICSLIDIDCFIDYYCLELFISNNDWPGNNMRCYQHDDGRWRWIFFDGDDCLMKMNFDVFNNATSITGNGWPNSPKSTLLFRKLLENQNFKSKFLSRFTELITEQFSYVQTMPLLQDAAARVRLAIPEQAERYHRPNSSSQWENQVTSIDRFLQQRPSKLFEEMNQLFTVDVTDATVCPNPAHDHLTVTIEKSTPGITNLTLYDILGHLMLSNTFLLYPGENSYHFDLTLPPGIYIMKIGSTTQRITII